MKHIHTKDVKTCNIRASQAIAIHNETATQSVAGRRTSLARRQTETDTQLTNTKHIWTTSSQSSSLAHCVTRQSEGQSAVPPGGRPTCHDPAAAGRNATDLAGHDAFPAPPSPKHPS